MKEKSRISLDDIRNMIREQAGVDRCVLCGKCASVCPSFRELQTEVFSPRGRMALSDAFLKERLSPGGRYFESLLCCLGCRACEKACPARVRPGWANLLLKNLPEFKKLHENLINILHKDRNHHYPENLFKHLGFKISRESFMESFKKSGKESKPPDISSEVFYFPGCINNHIFPEVARSTAGLLERLGFQAVIPSEFYCCGAPHIFLGDLKTGRDLAEKNLKAFEEHQDKTIICDCAGCASTIRLWGDLFPEGSDEKILTGKIVGNIRTLSEFLKEHSPSIFSRIPDLNSIKWADEITCPGWAMWLLSGYSAIPARILHRINQFIEDKKITSIITEDSACYAFLKKNLLMAQTISLSEYLENIGSYL
jgi:glycolate oxidase iron-sulfur subunit